MRVADIMTSKPLFCRRETDLGAAAEMFWNGNCGFLPLVADGGRVVGAVTDRDICIALGTRDLPPGKVTVGEIASGPPACCKPDDTIEKALAMMGARHVHRLVVVDATGKLAGVLSVDDILGKAIKHGASDGVTPTDLVANLKEITRHQIRPNASAPDGAAG